MGLSGGVDEDGIGNSLFLIAGIPVGTDPVKAKMRRNYRNELSDLRAPEYVPVLMDSVVTIVTPTGARPEAFEICTRMVRRQTFRQWRWIVVDDGPTVTVPNSSELSSLFGNDCLRLRPAIKWEGQNTQGRNLQMALAECRSEWIAFMEDDDWYHPEYLERMLSKATTGHQIGGEALAKYYHLPSRGYKIMGNRHHASLSQTVIHRGLAPCLQNLLETQPHSHDIKLWAASWSVANPFLFPRSSHVVSMKGLPGRPGIGQGHRSEEGWFHDRSGTILAELIGADTALYSRFLKNENEEHA